MCRQVGAVSDRVGVPDSRLKQFGAHVRQLREARDLTIEDLAEAAGVGARQVARVEAGRSSPSLLWLLAMASGLGVRPTSLLKPFD